MIDQAAFAGGLGVIALQLNKPITPAVIKAYHAAFADETSAEEWAAFCRKAVLRSGWTFLPTVAELRDALEEYRGATPLQREAVQAYEAVVASAEYAPETGSTWTYRRTEELCGRAAAEAYLAAGGHAAFSTTWDEAKRRERFIVAYMVAGRAAPADRLLMAPTSKLLGPGEVRQLEDGGAPVPAADPGRITREEAGKVIERLRALAGVDPTPPPKPQVVATEERLAELRRQAAVITSDVPDRTGEEA